MVRLFALALVVISNIAYAAETYICIAEAGAGVEHGDKGIHAAIYDVSNKKYIQSNEQGEWVVKELGNEIPIFDKCISSSFCERKEMYGGTFIRGPDGVFTIVWLTGNKEALTMLVAKGRCSKVSH
ncbi:hypothetical protein Nit79A3_1430 [Nitrosomonas sp. Is79A3]|uniref:hypothetical protein n=1 Tax=Nitrosomonas sp. (strain Is79A3) TaxID=261292 RepID=UPI000215CFF7